MSSFKLSRFWVMLYCIKYNRFIEVLKLFLTDLSTSPSSHPCPSSGNQKIGFHFKLNEIRLFTFTNKNFSFPFQTENCEKADSYRRVHSLRWKSTTKKKKNIEKTEINDTSLTTRNRVHGVPDFQLQTDMLRQIRNTCKRIENGVNRAQVTRKNQRQQYF